MFDVDLIRNVFFMVKNDLKAKYKTTDLTDKFIEASDSIISILHALGYEDAHVVADCARYNTFWGLSNEKHMWIKLNGFYIDIAAEQFNLCQDNLLNKIAVNEEL